LVPIPIEQVDTSLPGWALITRGCNGPGWRKKNSSGRAGSGLEISARADL